MNYLLGCDVSLYDRVVDWSKAKSMLSFAFIKTSEYGKDPMFEQQWAAAKGHVARGGYHFFHAHIDPKRQADLMASCFNGDYGELAPVIDLEVANGRQDVMARAKVFCDEVLNITGQRPIMYSRVNFLVENGAFKKTIMGTYKNAWLKDMVYWDARYPFDNIGDEFRAKKIEQVLSGDLTLTMPKVELLKIRFWQWTSRAKPEQIPGFDLGPNHKLAVDLNFFDGNVAELQLPPVSEPVPEAPIPVPQDDQLPITLHLKGNIRVTVEAE